MHTPVTLTYVILKPFYYMAIELDIPVERIDMLNKDHKENVLTCSTFSYTDSCCIVSDCRNSQESHSKKE